MYVHERRENWFEASDMCQKMGKQLLTINSESDNKGVALLGAKFSLKLVWVAAADIEIRSTTITRGWIWKRNGHMIKYLFWEDGEPNNWLEHCIEVKVNVLPKNWNDVDCMEKRSVICED